MTMKRVPHPAYALAVFALPAQLQGMPLDWAKSQLLSRAGVPFTDPDDPKWPDAARPHPLRAGLVHTHATSAGRDVRRVAAVLPIGDKPPATLGGWLALLDASAVLLLEGTDPSTGRAIRSHAPDPVQTETVMVDAPGEDPVATPPPAAEVPQADAPVDAHAGEVVTA